MVKRIDPYEDIIVQIVPLSGDDELLDYREFDLLTVRAYTTDITKAVEVDADTMENFLLRMPAEVIAPLDPGIIHLEITVGLVDMDYPDGIRDIVRHYDTNYYKRY